MDGQDFASLLGYAIRETGVEVGASLAIFPGTHKKSEVRIKLDRKRINGLMKETKSVRIDVVLRINP